MDNDTKLRKRIQVLEDRLRDAGAIANRTIALERDLGFALAAIASLKHKLFLIGSEDEIQAAIEQHSVGLYMKSALPKIGIAKKRKAKRPHR